MPRYVMSHRRAGRFRTEEKLASRAAMAYSVQRVGDLSAHPTCSYDNLPADDARPAHGGLRGGRRGGGGDCASCRCRVRLRRHHRAGAAALASSIVASRRSSASSRGRARLAAAPAGTGRTFVVEALSAGAPLAHATVYLFLQGQRREPHGAHRRDRCRREGHLRPQRLLAAGGGPRRRRTRTPGGWSCAGRRRRSIVECPPLPAGPYAPWWHEVLRLDAAAGSSARRGDPRRGLRHRLRPARRPRRTAWTPAPSSAARTIPGAGADVDSHGTHVSGIIGGRAAEAWHQGIAPGCGPLRGAGLSARQRRQPGGRLERDRRALEAAPLRPDQPQPREHLALGDRARRDGRRLRARHALDLRGRQRRRPGLLPGELRRGGRGLGPGPLGLGPGGGLREPRHPPARRPLRRREPLPRGLQLLRPGDRRRRPGRRHRLERPRAPRPRSAPRGDVRHFDGQPGGLRRTRRAPRRAIPTTAPCRATRAAPRERARSCARPVARSGSMPEFEGYGVPTLD